jgi:hypothetical protein
MTTVISTPAVETPAVIPAVNTTHIPQEIKELRQWVSWKFEKRDGKPIKVPYNPAGGPASCSDPATWGSFEEALHANGGLVGFQLQAPYVVIDLDKCRDPETRTISPLATALMRKLDSYTEVSPSGTGIHIWVRGKLPIGRRRTDGFEIYDSSRFMTVTGDVVVPKQTIPDRSAELLEVYREAFQGKDHGVRLADYGGDHSAADLALANKLAHEIDRQFRESSLMRPKWDEKHYSNGQTYGEHTIQLAMADLALPERIEVYTGEELLNTKFPEQQFLIGQKLLPRGGRMMITAENATGKSALALYISACLTTGTPLFGFTRRKKDANYGQGLFPVLGKFKVLYLDYEITHGIRKTERLAPLAAQFGSEFVKNISFPKHPTDFRLDQEKEFENLKRLLDEQRPDVLVIDPFSSTHCLDENGSVLKMLLNRLDWIISHYGCAVIVVHHASTKKLRDRGGKEVKKGAKEMARGWSGITDWLDFDLHLETEKEQGGAAGEHAAGKLLRLEFAKLRHRKPIKPRHVTANIGEMTFVGISPEDGEDA